LNFRGRDFYHGHLVEVVFWTLIVLPPNSYYPYEPSLFLTAPHHDELVNANVVPHDGAGVELVSEKKTKNGNMTSIAPHAFLVDQGTVFDVAGLGGGVVCGIEDRSVDDCRWTDEIVRACVRVIVRERPVVSDMIDYGFYCSFLSDYRVTESDLAFDAETENEMEIVNRRSKTTRYSLKPNLNADLALAA
jgi:hypothetical protein